MNKLNPDVVNANEKVVSVAETCDGRTRRFHAIRDVQLNCWRSTGAIDEYNAWTRDISMRAEFATRADAEREMRAIWGWRLMMSKIAQRANLPKEGAA